MIPVIHTQMKAQKKPAQHGLTHKSSLNSAELAVATDSPHRVRNMTNELHYSPCKRLFSSRLAASAKGRASVVPYSADTIHEYNSFQVRKSKTECITSLVLHSSPIRPVLVSPRNHVSPSELAHHPISQHHELSTNSIVYQPTSKQVVPTVLTSHIAKSEKIKEHNAFLTQSPLSRTLQIFEPSVEPKRVAPGATRSRSDILHSALCNILAKNYHSRRVQNAAMLFLEIGGFSPKILDDEMKHYKKNQSHVHFDANKPASDVEESTTSICCSTFSEIANAMQEVSVPVFSEIDNLDALLDKHNHKDVKRLSYIRSIRSQSRPTFLHVETEHTSLDNLWSNGLLPSSSADCLMPRRRRPIYQPSNALAPLFDRPSNTDSEPDSSSKSEIQCIPLGQGRYRVFSRSFSLPRKSYLTDKQPLSNPENIDGEDLSFFQPFFSRQANSISKRQTPDNLREENELRQVARDAKLRRVQSFGEFSVPRRRKSKITHFIPDFSCFKSNSMSPQNVSVVSELNEYHSINEKLGHVEAIGRSISNHCRTEHFPAHLSVDEAQHMLTLLCKDYYTDLERTEKDKRYKGIRRITHCNIYPYQTKERGYCNIQSNDYALIEAILAHVQRPVLHNYGVSHSIISYCNTALHKCRMGTLFETLSLGRSFLYIVDFHMDMDTYFPQVLALMLQEHPKRTRLASALVDDPPCVLPTDNPVINKTEIPVLKIRHLFIDLSHSGLLDRAATVLNDCVNKRFFDLYMLFPIQSFADSFSDINVLELDLSWELAFKLCYRILFDNEDSHPAISWTPYGDVSYLISLAVFTGRCADEIFNSLDCKESLLYTLILNYSIYEATYILLSAYKRYEENHGPPIPVESPLTSSEHSSLSTWQSGSIFEIFTADLPIQFSERYPETNPLIETHLATFQWLIGLQLTTDFRLFEAIGLLIQNSHISILISNLRRLKFLLILLIHVLHGYVLSSMHAANAHKPTGYLKTATSQSKKSTIQDPFLITNLFYAIGAILGILLDKRIAQEQFNLELLSNSTEEIHPETKEAIYDLICLQSYCVRMLLLLLPHFLDGKELDFDSEVREYGLISIYASPYQDFHGLIPPYILLHDIRYIYGHLDFVLRPESLPAQHVILKHYCVGFLIRMIRSAISFNTISDLNSLLFMRNPLCLSIFWALRKQPLASKYSLTHWYIDKFTQMTDRNFA